MCLLSTWGFPARVRISQATEVFLVSSCIFSLPNHKTHLLGFRLGFAYKSLGFKTQQKFTHHNTLHQKMSSSIGFSALSRKLYRSLLSTPSPYRHLLPLHFSTTNPLSDSDESTLPDSPPPPDSTQQQQQQRVFDRPLENGLDVGIYRVLKIQF